MTPAHSALTRKYGPLPAWAWVGLLAVGGYLLYRHLSASGSIGSLTSTAPDVTETNATPVGEDASGGGGGDAGAGAGLGTPINTPPDVQPAPDTTSDASGGPTPADSGTLVFIPESAPTPVYAASSYNYGGGPYSAPPPSSVYTNPVTGLTSTIPSGTVTGGGSITGRGVQGGL